MAGDGTLSLSEIKMQTTQFSFHNDQRIEIFIENRGTTKDGFEVWIVGDGKGGRVMLDHLITHDDTEARLCYAQPGDLIWKAAKKSEIPDQKTAIAVEYEIECLDKGMFRDDPNGNMATHLHTLISMPRDRKTMNIARKAIIGTWTDGVAILNLQPESKLEISCFDRSHPLYYWAPQAADAPPILGACVADWWNFSTWYLWIFNQQSRAGEKMAVWRCDASELHLTSFHGGDTFAHVYRRVETD